MFAPELKETVGLNQCHDCGAELLDRDKFCRRCGVKQPKSYTASTDPSNLSPCETRPMTGSTGGYSSYSGQLIRIVTESLSSRTATQSTSRGFRRLVCMLITIPIWMLIVMLSPLDAYTAAKAAAECVN